MRESTLKRFLRQPHFDELLELHRLDCLASHGWLDNYDFVQSKLSELPPERLKPARLISAPIDRSRLRAWPALSADSPRSRGCTTRGRIHTREEALAVVENDSVRDIDGCRRDLPQS